MQRSATERRKESHPRGAPRKAAVTDPNTPASGVDRIRTTVKSSRASPPRQSRSPALYPSAEVRRPGCITAALVLLRKSRFMRLPGAMHRLGAASVDTSTRAFSSAFIMCDSFRPFVANKRRAVHLHEHDVTRRIALDLEAARPRRVLGHELDLDRRTAFRRRSVSGRITSRCSLTLAIRA